MRYVATAHGYDTMSRYIDNYRRAPNKCLSLGAFAGWFELKNTGNNKESGYFILSACIRCPGFDVAEIEQTDWTLINDLKAALHFGYVRPATTADLTLAALRQR